MINKIKVAFDRVNWEQQVTNRHTGAPLFTKKKDIQRLAKAMKNRPIVGDRAGYCVVPDGNTEYVISGVNLRSIHGRANKQATPTG